MALACTSSLSTKSLPQSHSESSMAFVGAAPHLRSVIPCGGRARLITAVHAVDPAKNPSVTEKPSSAATILSPARPGKWTVGSWKLKKALQLPEYPNKEDLESVLRTIESFPPIVFAGEARNLEERLGEAALGRAFLLQGGDCAESFKEFNANNIRDTLRVLLQMSAVLMFGSQMPVIKVAKNSGSIP